MILKLIQRTSQRGHAPGHFFQPFQVGAVMHQRVRPRHVRRHFAGVRNAGPGGLKHGKAVGIRVMQRIDQPIERLPQLRQPVGFTRPVIGGALAAEGQRVAKLLQHAGLAGLGRMQFQAKRAKPDAGQAAVHHFKCGHLFGHEQHRLALGQAVRNQVGDGLALAGAGRAFEHQIASGIDRANRLELRRIRQHRRQDVLRAVRCIQMVKLACRAFAGKRFTGVVDQVFDDAVLLELLGAVLQVFPHQVLGE